MIRFPVLESARIDDFGLYPGLGEQGVDIRFDTNLSVIVGANGLGKSTLLLMLFRTLTGPTDIPGAVRDGELGSAKLEPKGLNRNERRTFAARVSDGAQNASATVTIRLGEAVIKITRSLRDLTLTEWTVDNVAQPTDESAYQNGIATACGVWSFADWILILRYVTFYMDDRQVLFWDRSAQKQLLRSLFLSPSEAEHWVSLERRVLELDSRQRNFRNVYNGESSRVARLVAPDSAAHADLHNELTALIAQDEADLQTQEALLEEIAALDERRAKTNLERLQSIQRLDEASRAYEHSKLVALTAQFPTTSDTALFIWNQLLADETCLLCGNEAPHVRAELENRLATHHCIVCASDRSSTVNADAAPVDLGVERSERAWADLEAHRESVHFTEIEHEEVQQSLREARAQSAELEVRRSITDRRIGALRSQLPPDVDGFMRDRSQLSSMRARLDELTAQLAVEAESFNSFVAEKTGAILASANAIKDRFDHYAALFLLGRGELMWSPREERIGQSSHRVTFPAYELQLIRNDSDSETDAASVRSGMDEVSESQKEFIDLAFRMALIEAAGGQSGATLVIDTPESSLDRVFSKRAASVLSDFATSAGNRLLVASNLTDGQLIPQLIGATNEQSGEFVILNLLDVARPTPAVRELGAEYREAYDRLMESVV
ncbi:AAA family ATPase [Microbacterium sp. KSW4-16]|uniref:AAA family ATPase n=1 Tax=Microbacterium aurugineum TaxID=2851642 RepID=UPI0020C09D75|nr:AAA family ATPase [Microbacterium aurugineum]MCK8467154.1 AAA family ATPase [Microbacterium aurugineum]